MLTFSRLNYNSEDGDVILLRDISVRLQDYVVSQPLKPQNL
jgi:hypothetical protein